MRSLSVSATRMQNFGVGVTFALLAAAPLSALAQMKAPAAAPPAAAPPAAASPHGAARGGPPQSGSIPDSSLPAGSILVDVLGAQGQPLEGIVVQLAEQFQSVAQGNETKILKQTTSKNGKASFTSLENSMRFSYGVSVTRNGADYSVQSFRLGKVGQHVIVRTFPVTHDLAEAAIGMRGFTYVQLSADALKVDVLYRVMNMSQQTWLPKDLVISLPEGASAIDTGNVEGVGGFKKLEDSVRLVGSYPPGQKDAQFSYRLPNTDEATRVLKFSVPPHLGELRVLAETAPGMSLDVSPGFGPPQEAKGPGDGKNVLITRRLMKPGEQDLSEVTVVLSGLPVRGPGRWFALLGAILILLVGIGGLLKKKSKRDKNEDQHNARQTLLEEMFVLQRAFEREQIGPQNFEQMKREILKALARLESLAPAKSS